MDCQEIRERISEYIDGMLPAEATSEITDHIERCETCRLEYESIASVVRIMKQMDPVQEPEDFLENVTARLDTRFSLRHVFRRFFIPVRIKLPLEAAAIAAVAILVFYISGIRDTRGPYDIHVTLKERGTERRGHKKGERPGVEEKKGLKRETALVAFIASAGGHVVQTDYDDVTGEPERMIIEMTAGNVPELWRVLDTTGMIDTPLPAVPSDNEAMVRITVWFPQKSP